ncbi:MAG: endolytic transglycosylase MltG [Acidobacteria bacterium]|nr:endolytic transglycosylase MltG [Acidobacteriota bacterium]
MKRTLLATAALGLAMVAAIAGYATWGWKLLHEAQGPRTRVSYTVVPGQSAGQILDRLSALGLLPDATLARLYLVYYLDDPPLQAGEYSFPSPATTPEVLDRMVRGKVVEHPVTLIEGQTLQETAQHLAAEGFGDYETFLALMRSPASIIDLDPEATTLEGYLFPDTYHFPRSATEVRIVDTLVDTFRRHLETNLGTDYDGSLRDLVILASIVEKEAQLDSERPIIAGIYSNRLERGIGLYADPTIIFALKQLGRWDGDIRRRDLALDSPYNTYLYPGLPPGPICSAGLASLRAAAAPADVPYLYFVSRNDGSHVFARTLREHNRNVDEWQRRYWRQRRAEGSK